jgi:hypothetical protein
VLRRTINRAVFPTLCPCRKHYAALFIATSISQLSTYSIVQHALSLAILGLALGSLFNRFVIGRKAQADAVDAVPLISGSCEAFALENMAEVAATVRAHDFGAGHAESLVLVASYGSGDAVEVGRPAAAGLELVGRLVKWSVAGGAGVDAL